MWGPNNLRLSRNLNKFKNLKINNTSMLRVNNIRRLLHPRYINH